LSRRVASEYTVASFPSTHQMLSPAALDMALLAHCMHFWIIACSPTVGHRLGRITTLASNGSTSIRRVFPSCPLLNTVADP